MNDPFQTFWTFESKDKDGLKAIYALSAYRLSILIANPSYVSL